MSLFNLIHKNVIIKFTHSARDPFDPAASYVFRLTGVDGMGFLQIQDLKPGSEAGHEPVSEPYWINKDLVREIHELHEAKVKKNLLYGGPAKTQVVPVHREVTPKPAKAKTPAKPKPVLN